MERSDFFPAADGNCGGALRATNALTNVAVYDSSFTGNRALQTGGAVCADNLVLSIIPTSFFFFPLPYFLSATI
jgi:predicted outer membrane repeat protein